MKEAEVLKQSLLNFSEPRVALSGIPGTILQEHTLDAPVDKIWQALTEPKYLNNWFGLENSVTPKVGGTMFPKLFEWRWVNALQKMLH